MYEAKLSRKEREKVRHRKEILDVSLRLFSCRGFHNVSMQDIAIASEFAVGTLYKFFTSKEQLFVELMRTGVEEIASLLVPVLDSGLREDQKLSAFIRVHADIIEQNINYIKLYISHYGTNIANPILKNISGKLKTDISKKLERVITSGVNKGIFVCFCPDIIVLSLRATLEAFCLEFSEHFDRGKVKEGLEQIDKFFLNSLLKQGNNQT